MPEIISRKEARARGLKRFFTGKPCKHGHISEGWTCGMSCIVCFRAQSLSHYYKNHESMKALMKAKRDRERRYQKTCCVICAKIFRQTVPGRRITCSTKCSAENKRCTDQRFRISKPRKKAVRTPKFKAMERERIRRYKAKPEVKKKYNALNRKYWVSGPINPKDEMQWLRKSRAQ